MARELYNWDQARGYLITAASNYNKKNNNSLDTVKLIREFDSLQTQFGKEGIIGLANRLLNKQ